MRKYIILTPNIYALGGAQLYVLRRAKYLKKKGYQVYIVVSSSLQDFPLRDKFKEFIIFRIPELNNMAYHLSPKRISELVEEILNDISYSFEDEVLIESHRLIGIIWGEYIANKCRGKHLAYPLAEPDVFERGYSSYRGLFEYKLKKGEFYGCTSLSLNRIFNRNVNTNNYVNIAFDEQEFVDVSSPAINFSRTDNEYVITTISRLEKEYVEPFIKDVVQFVKGHPEHKFILRVIGDSAHKNVTNRIFSTYSNTVLNVSNLNVVFTGYINQLGKDVFKNTDLYVGMGTTAINSISQSCVTLIVNPRTFDSPGVFGTECFNFAYPEGKSFNMIEKLEEIYSASSNQLDLWRRNGRSLFEREYELNYCFEKLDEAINNIDYRDTKYLLIYPYFKRILWKIRSLIKG